MLVGYSAGNFGKNMLLGGVDVTLLFILTDLLHINPASAGAVMAVILVGDLAFDIGIGFVAAWLRDRGVGYRTLIGVGALPCTLGFALFYGLPLFGFQQFAVVVGILLLFRGAYALVDLPHNSLLARVACDSRSRGRTSGYRLLFSSLASLAIATLLTPATLAARTVDGSRWLALIGLLAAVASCLALWLSAWSSSQDQVIRSTRPKRSSQIALFPKPDRLLVGLLVLVAVIGFAMPMLGRMTIYLATYVYNRPALASHMLLALTLGQFPGIALWTVLVRVVSKTHLLLASHGLAMTALLLLSIVGPEPSRLLPVTAMVGVGFAGVFMFPWGIMADAIDVAEFRYRERREAATVALMLVTVKASAAAATGVIGFGLAWLGYHAGRPATPAVIWGVRLGAFGTPVLGSLASIIVVSKMAMRHSTHARVLRALDTRRARRSVNLKLGRLP